MNPEIKKEFNRLFKFIVKHGPNLVRGDNNYIKRFLKWAWSEKRIFIINEGNQIIAVLIAWRTPEVVNKFERLDLDTTENGNYLYISQCLIHPDHKHKGYLLPLLIQALYRYDGVDNVFWHDRRGKHKIINTDRLLNRLCIGVNHE